MKLTAYYDRENEVVFAVADGQVTTENLKATTRKALELSKKHNCYHLLFDITKCTESQSILQGFLDMENMEKTTGLTFKHKCAVIYNPAIYPNERARFIENVVTNRINPDFKMFTRQQKALAWLRK